MLGVWGAVVPGAGAVAATTPGPDPDCAHVPGEHLGAEFIRPDVSMARLDGASDWWDQGAWDDELEMLSALCVEDVVLQWTAQTWVGDVEMEGMGKEPAPQCVYADGKGRYVLPLFASADGVWDANRQARGAECGAGSGRGDQVRFALEAARKSQMRVWLGLQLDEPGFFRLGGEGNSAWMQQQATLSVEVMDQLWATYGAEYRDQIAGFYLPFEGNSRWYSANPDDEHASGMERSFTRFQALNAYTDAVSTHAKALDAGLGAMTAPYIVASIGADPSSQVERTARDRFEGVVKDLVAGSGVTVFAPQDSVAAQNSSSSDVAPWAVAAQRGLQAAGTGTRLWLVVEQYSMQGIGSLPVMELVSHMRNANKPVPAYTSGVDRAGVVRFLGFSSNNFSPRSAYWSYSWWYREAYKTYLSFPVGAEPVQKVPKVGTTTFPNNTTVTAAVVSGTLDVTVQWPIVEAVPAPQNGSFTPIAIVGYQVFRNGQPIGQVLQPLKSSPGEVNRPAGGVMAFTDPSVQTGRTYQYEVSAFDAFGNSSPRVGVTVTAPMTAADALVAGGTDRGGARVSENAPYTVVTAGGNPGYLWDRVVAGNSAGAYRDGKVVSKLVDGSTGQPRYADPAWTGFQTGKAVQVEVGLPAEATFDTVRTNWLKDGATGIQPPKAVTVSSRAAGRPDTAPVTPLPAGTDPGTGAGPGQALPETDFANPGTGWMTANLPAGQAVTAQALIIDVTPTDSNAWAFLSEIEVLTPAGENLCADGTCTAIIRDAAGTEVSDAVYRSNERRTLTDPAAIRADQSPAVSGNPSTLNAKTVGWVGTTGIDIVIDLGENTPIGAIRADFWNMPQWAASAPASVAMSYLRESDTPDSHTPDLSPAGAWSPTPAAATTTDTSTGTGSLRTFTAAVPTTGGGHAQEAVLARWVKLHITNTATGNWILATALAVHAPAAWDLTSCTSGTTCPKPRIYNTNANTNSSFDPAKKPDKTTNWPTNIPKGLPLLEDQDALPIPQEVCGATGGSACRTASPAGTGVLVAKGTTGIPIGPTGTDYNDFIDKALVFGAAPRAAWDVIVPLDWKADTGNTWSTINAPAITLLYNPKTGTGLPASIDLLFAEDHVGSGAADVDRTWKWSGATARAPILPPYLPAGTAFLHTYTFPPVKSTVGTTIDLLRFHLNPTTTGSNLVAARVQAATWK